MDIVIGLFARQGGEGASATGHFPGMRIRCPWRPLACIQWNGETLAWTCQPVVWRQKKRGAGQSFTLSSRLEQQGDETVHRPTVVPASAPEICATEQ